MDVAPADAGERVWGAPWRAGTGRDGEDEKTVIPVAEPDVGRVEIDPTAGAVHLTGSFDLLAVDAAWNQVLEQVDQAWDFIIIDLSQVTHLSAAGVRLLDACVWAATDRDLEIWMRADPGSVAHLVLEEAGLASYLIRVGPE